jgi:hypothetical protein
MNDLPERLNASLTVYKGDDRSRRRHHYTEAELDCLPFSVSQGFGTLRAIVVSHLRRLLAPLVVEDHLQLKIRPTVTTPQNKFLILNEKNFQEQIASVHYNFSLKQKPEDIRIPIFVFIEEKSVQENAAVLVEAAPMEEEKMKSAEEWAPLLIRCNNSDPFEILIHLTTLKKALGLPQ